MPVCKLSKLYNIYYAFNWGITQPVFVRLSLALTFLTVSLNLSADAILTQANFFTVQLEEWGITVDNYDSKCFNVGKSQICINFSLN
jgi:hypothetical protein